MKKITRYQTEDGSEFLDESEAREYEANYELAQWLCEEGDKLSLDLGLTQALRIISIIKSKYYLAPKTNNP